MASEVTMFRRSVTSTLTSSLISLSSW
ncbi:unnamed protein product [Cuscuta europaea]|uniref:Uncharacterized protein n=1 Tax=Cuscuta europaea TaxID=41803 RepID=A0A9P0ZBB7_CUSEU|nr:unnamed protein product [Cuscuta europaea]